MNKKVLVFVTIFALLLGIGVGYAVVTQDLIFSETYGFKVGGLSLQQLKAERFESCS